jgi:hypothetical protein
MPKLSSKGKNIEHRRKTRAERIAAQKATYAHRMTGRTSVNSLSRLVTEDNWAKTGLQDIEWG